MKHLKRIDDRRPIWERYLAFDDEAHVHCIVVGISVCPKYRRASPEVVLDDNKAHVLVLVGKVPEKLCPFASITRLQPLDDCYMFIADAFEVGCSVTRKELWRVACTPKTPPK